MIVIRLKRAHVFVLLITNFIVSMSLNSSADEKTFEYVNDIGEEIFGPEYRPESASEISEPLLVAAPSAGAAVPSDLNGVPHSILRPKFNPLSLPGDKEQITPNKIRIPYRKAFILGQNPFIQPPKALTPKVPLVKPELADAEKVNKISSEKMYAHFIFVGQGDATILEFPCGVAVIDTGGEFGGGKRVNGGQYFIDYLEQFFKDRKHLKNTIDVVITTHPHADHLNGLPLLSNLMYGENPIKVRNVVDNGQSGKKGSLAKQTKFRQKVIELKGKYSAVELSQQISATGATNSVIDPIDCPKIDPAITVFWGSINEALRDNQLDSTSEYRNPNNHSVIVRVDFGASSFLFTGDLEDKGEEDLRNQFGDNLGVFDVDIYQVSHHGADDDTSDDFLKVMSPKIAVISMGEPGLKVSHTAWDHGHPRIGLLNVLQKKPSIVSDLRDPEETFLAAPKQNKFKKTKITRAIYGTGWEGTVVIGATSNGKYDIATYENQ